MCRAWSIYDSTTKACFFGFLFHSRIFDILSVSMLFNIFVCQPHACTAGCGTSSEDAL